MYIISEFAMAIGVINHVTANHTTMFIIFDQTIFQITISLSFFRLATTDAANSGKLVHNATIVSHIIVSDTPNELAIDLAALTITSAHNASHIDHQIIYNIDFQVGNLCECSSCSSSRFLIIQNV
jgi:hypothetical protein